MNRRFFLRGLGSAFLALPALPSLLPRTARAANPASPRRYVQLFNDYGPTGPLFFGGLQGTQQLAPGVKAASLTAVSGPLSSILGTSFDAVRAKLNVVRGIDVLANNPNHQFCFATTASGYASGLDGDGYPPEANNESIDVILSNSAKVYPANWSTTRRLVNFNPTTTDGYSRNRSLSWRRTASGSVQMVAPLKETQALLDLFMGSFGMAQMPQVDDRELTLMQAVHADYTRVRASPRLSAADRAKLDQYMALVSDLEAEARNAVTEPVVCQGPSIEPGGDATALVRTQLRVLAAAMVCDLTRIGSVTMGTSEPYDTRHAEHHQMYDSTVAPGFLGDLRFFAGNVGWFMQHLDSVQEGDGTLLDHSLVYWSMQYGCVYGGDTHSRTDMPIVVGGKAGGALSTGRYLDCRDGGKGLPMNNFLVALFNAMGLSSGDFEKSGETGYGLYTGTALDGRPDRDAWLSAAGKRTPVPGLYAGPVMG